MTSEIRQKAREWHIHNDFEYWSDEEVAAFAESLLSGGADSRMAYVKDKTTKVVPMSCLDSSVLQTDRDGEYQVRTSRLTCNTAASEIGADSGTGEESDPKIPGAAPPAASEGQPAYTAEDEIRKHCPYWPGCPPASVALVGNRNPTAEEIKRGFELKPMAKEVLARNTHLQPTQMRAASGSGTPSFPLTRAADLDERYTVMELFCGCIIRKPSQPDGDNYLLPCKAHGRIADVFLPIVKRIQAEARADEARRCAADVCEFCREGSEAERSQNFWTHGDGDEICNAGDIHERLHRESQKGGNHAKTETQTGAD